MNPGLSEPLEFVTAIVLPSASVRKSETPLESVRRCLRDPTSGSHGRLACAISKSLHRSLLYGLPQFGLQLDRRSGDTLSFFCLFACGDLRCIWIGKFAVSLQHSVIGTPDFIEPCHMLSSVSASDTNDKQATPMRRHSERHKAVLTDSI